MREVILKLDGLVCEAQLCDSRRNVLAEARIELNGPTNWYELLAKVGDELKLMQHPPPGLTTQGDAMTNDECRRTNAPRSVVSHPWQPDLCGFGMPGYGWGFWLPPEAPKAVKSETCCGFRDEAAAVKAATFLKNNHDVITGDLPNGVFEVFGYAGKFTFIDLHGIVHSFSERQQAQAHAGKLEGTQMAKPD